MLGIECEKPAKEIIAAAMEKGVLVLSAKTKVRLLPPLNIPFELLENAMDILTEIIDE
jgi:acetylornithine/N-succinyldiaminopimelate aminotransferase